MAKDTEAERRERFVFTDEDELEFLPPEELEQKEKERKKKVEEAEDE